MSTEIVIGNKFKIRPYGNGECYTITRRIVTRNGTVRWGKQKYQRTLKDTFRAIRRMYIHEEMYSSEDEIIEDCNRFEEILDNFNEELKQVEVRNSEFLDKNLKELEEGLKKETA